YRFAQGARAEVGGSFQTDRRRKTEAAHRTRLQTRRSGAGAAGPRSTEDDRQAAARAVSAGRTGTGCWPHGHWKRCRRMRQDAFAGPNRKSEVWGARSTVSVLMAHSYIRLL